MLYRVTSGFPEAAGEASKRSRAPARCRDPRYLVLAFAPSDQAWHVTIFRMPHPGWYLDEPDFYLEPITSRRTDDAVAPRTLQVPAVSEPGGRTDRDARTGALLEHQRRREGSHSTAQALIGPRLKGGPPEVLARVESGPARHDLGPGSVARAGHLRPRGPDRPCPHRRGVLGIGELHLRVLVPRGMHPSSRGLACLRLQASGHGHAGTTLAPPRGRRQELLVRPRPSPGRWAALSPGAGEREKGGPWWDWSKTKIAAEWLLDIGELVCRERKGFQRVYDLAERAVPAEILGTELSDEACQTRLVAAAAGALGVATASDLAAYHGLTRRQVEHVIMKTDLLQVAVEGWARPAYASQAALDGLDRRMRGRALLLSPFDSLTWYRDRPNAFSDSVTVSRPMSPTPSESTGTSRCRCWAVTASSAWWILAAADTPLSPSMSPSRPRTPLPCSRRHFSKPPAG